MSSDVRQVIRIAVNPGCHPEELLFRRIHAVNPAALIKPRVGSGGFFRLQGSRQNDSRQYSGFIYDADLPAALHYSLQYNTAKTKL